MIVMPTSLGRVTIWAIGQFIEKMALSAASITNTSTIINEKYVNMTL